MASRKRIDCRVTTSARVVCTLAPVDVMRGRVRPGVAGRACMQGLHEDESEEWAKSSVEISRCRGRSPCGPESSVRHDRFRRMRSEGDSVSGRAEALFFQEGPFALLGSEPHALDPGHRLQRSTFAPHLMPRRRSAVRLARSSKTNALRSF